MKTLIVGYGSIGQRHARILNELGLSVAVVSKQLLADTIVNFSDLKQALEEWNPEYIVIANETDKHYNSLEILIEENFKGKVLVEKPLFDKPLDISKNNFTDSRVAYNLRLHPFLMKVKNVLAAKDKLIISANIYVGAYLPDWRPNTDYRNSYSASKEKGGGVLRDLSHELDYAQWFFGKWKRLTSIGGHFSNLDITSDDVFSILMETENCPLVHIHLNYLDKKPYREILINTTEETIRVSLTENSIEINGNREEIKLERDFTYQEEHKAMLSGDTDGLCNFEEGYFTLKTIDAAQRASESKIWIQN